MRKNMGSAISLSKAKPEIGKETDAKKELKELRDALRMRRKVWGGKHANVAATLSSIGVIHEKRGEYDEAMAAYVDALSVYNVCSTSGRGALQLQHSSSSLSPTSVAHSSLNNGSRETRRHHPEIALCLSSIAEIHCRWFEYDQALAVFGEALRVQKSYLGDYHSDVATTLRARGKIEYEKGYLEDAKISFEEELNVYKELSKKVQGSSDTTLQGNYTERIAEVYTWMGKTEFARGSFGNAMLLYKDSLDIQSSIYGDMHPSTATVRLEMGRIHCRNALYDKAMEDYEYAQKVTESTLGKKHPSMAMILVCIGNVHEKRNNYQHAMQLYKQSLQTDQMEDSSLKLQRALTLEHIGNVHTELEEYDMAMKAYTDALATKEGTLGKDHPSVARTLVCVGNVHALRNDHENAMQLFEEAKKSQEASLGSEHVDFATTLNKIAMVQSMMGGFEEAMALFLRVLAIYTSSFGPDHPEVAYTLVKVGEIQLHWDELDSSMATFSEALRIQTTTQTPDHLDIGDTYVHIGDVHVKRHQFLEAQSLFEQALHSYKTGGLVESHMRVKVVHEKIGNKGGDSAFDPTFCTGGWMCGTSVGILDFNREKKVQNEEQTITSYLSEWFGQ